MPNRDKTSYTYHLFPDFSSWRHLLELLFACNVLALVLAIWQVANLQQLTWLSVIGHLLFVNWVAICFALCVSKLQIKLRGFTLYCSAVIYFILLMLLILFSSILVNFLQALGDQFTVQISLSLLLEESLQRMIVGGGLGMVCMRYLYVRELLLQRQRAELMARVQALQVRIQPHFLFNSLNSVVSLIAIEPLKAEQLLIDLSSLFRASLAELKEVSLQEEIRLCQRYLKIESIRLGERLEVNWRIEPSASFKQAKIPFLTLQPLLENCISHGVEPMALKSVVTILIEVVDKQVSLVLTNPYPLGRPAMQGNGIAIDNVKQRLYAYYGTSVRFNIFAKEGLYTTVLSYKYQ